MKTHPHPTASRTSENLIFFLFLGSLLTPLIYNDTSFFGFITERTWFFYAVTDCMVVIALLTPGFLTTTLSRLQGAVLLFLGILSLADGLGVDPLLSYFSSYTRLDGFVTYLHLGLYFLVLARTPFPKTRWNTALLVSAGMAMFVVLKGYFSATGWQPIDRRLVATVGNPSFLASYLLMNLFIVIYLSTQFPTVSRWIKSLIVGLMVITLTGGIYLTGTRSAVLGLVAGIIFLSSFITWQRQRALWPIALRLILVLALLFGLFRLALTSNFLQKSSIVYRLTHYSGVNNTLSPRYVCWKIGLDAFAERPWLGWGQETFSYGFARHFDPAILIGGTFEWYDRTHSVLVDWAYSAGMGGLLAYLLIWVALVYTLRTNGTILTLTERGILGSVFVAYFFFNILNVDSLLPLQTFFLLLALVNTTPQSAATTRVVRTWLVPVRVAALLMMTVLVRYGVYELYRTGRDLKNQQNLGDVQQRFDALEKTYHQATLRSLDLADLLESQTLAILQSDAQPSVKQFCYQRTVQVINQQVDRHPGYTRLLARAASLFLAGGDIDRTIDLCKRAIAIEGPRRPSAYLQLGNAYLRRNEFRRAQALFDQAYQLQPGWQEPLLYKALAFAVQKDTLQCYRTMRTIHTETLVSKLNFVKQVYLQTGHPHAFVERIDQTDSKAQFSPQVFMEWALMAFDTHDTVQMTSALNSFYNHYLHERFTYPQVKQIIDDGLRGVRPDVLATMIPELSR
ncbi:O-antigen ligase family protein [Spirosoma utsteinense]|uniref:O-antigen ligase/tetratricopeptide (TPR) repeat protein n=1 Tax=Spirosoma utsteinense TaxID=2585773 RepID=A0ABR6WAX2_9BACT|nr:O-antigen ligase family protein [Spirosoma utsteinense]MBC3785778.1 O-antigen ligase/tetratricopeptide (TPR) repeat protein [Spirosoma utsteinense]MBC3793695.1 O-antigen ligase/tetratricopeptide (TPR) repeat protein [Spirosoma utsteinense]